MGSKIQLTYIDKNEESQSITDFGIINGFVQEVFDYLNLRKESRERAVLILTFKPNSEIKLASDTMRLPEYAGLWRNWWWRNRIRHSKDGWFPGLVQLITSAPKANRVQTSAPLPRLCRASSSLGLNWRSGTKAWGSNRIRYPGSPRCKRWLLVFGDILSETKRKW